MAYYLRPQMSGGEGQLVARYGPERFTADWDNPSHRVKRLLAEFLGVAGLMVILSGVAGILARYAGADVPRYQLVATAAVTSGTYLVAALAARDLVPGDVDKVFLSHIHFDHADNVDLFDDAVIYLGKADWDYVRNPAKDDLFIPWGIHEQLSKNKLELLEHDGDIGGGLTALELRGHTPGSMGIRFEHATNGTVVIAGDAIKNLDEVISGRQSNVEHRFPVAASLADDEASIAKVVRMADRIVPGHFPELKRDGTAFTPVGPQSLELQFR